MAGLALTKAESTFFAALEELGVRFLIVGLGAAVLQGADTVTIDIDVWLEDRNHPRIGEAAARAKGIWIPGHFGMMPPMLGGEALGDRLDVVTSVDGIDPFSDEYARSAVMEVDGIRLHVLPLERVIASKRAAARPKDLAVLPALLAALVVQQLRSKAESER